MDWMFGQFVPMIKKAKGLIFRNISSFGLGLTFAEAV